MSILTSRQGKLSVYKTEELDFLELIDRIREAFSEYRFVPPNVYDNPYLGIWVRESLWKIRLIAEVYYNHETVDAGRTHIARITFHATRRDSRAIRDLAGWVLKHGRCSADIHVDILLRISL